MTSPTQKKVLLVESEDSLARAMDMVVTADGHACARLNAGDRIVQRVSEDRPDLLLLDMTHANRMEAMDACQAIRRSPDLDQTKILVLQAGGAQGARRGKALGANATVSLPFRLDDLRTQMRRLLGETTVH